MVEATSRSSETKDEPIHRASAALQTSTMQFMTVLSPFNRKAQGRSLVIGHLDDLSFNELP